MRDARATPSPDLCKEFGVPDGTVFRFWKEACGLAQTPFEHYKTMREDLTAASMRRSRADLCALPLDDPDIIGLIVGHVDDCLVAGIRGNAKWEQLSALLPDMFEGSELQEWGATYCNMKVERACDDGFLLTQRTFVDDIKPLS